MNKQKPIISKQITVNHVTKCCNEDIKTFIENFYRFEYNWFYNAYNTFKDLEKYLILVFLINKTLKTYRDHFYSLSFQSFYELDKIEIEKIDIVEIVRELSISKETVRRKLNELNKQGIIIRNKKQISIINPFINQKPIANINELSKLLAWVSLELNKIYGMDLFDDKHFLNIIKKNYTLYWNIFLNFQFQYVIIVKKLFGSFDNFFIFGVCILNQSFNLKNAVSNEKKSLVNLLNFTEVLTNYTKDKSRGLNASSISDLTGMPRASVIRKLKILEKKKLIKKNKDKLFVVTTPKEHPETFKKIRKTFDKNQLLLRQCIKELLNQMII